MGRKGRTAAGLAATILAAGGCFGDATADLYAPVLQITNPVEDAIVSGVVNFTVNAIDDTGVAVVRFYAGTTLLGADEIAPYSWLWSTATRPDGNVRIRAEAEDLAGNTSSSEITVTIRNTPE